MRKIKIGYFADGPWAYTAFKKLNDDPSIEIAFIVPRIDTKDDTLLTYSKTNKIDYFPNSKINTTEFITKVKNYQCDLFVSMSFNQIFKNELINIPPLKSINCHAGKLPFYRGRNVLNWVLINDEPEFGITIHFIDEGIDTGDIILQKTFSINKNDNYTNLLKIAYVECAALLYDAIKLIQEDKHNRIPQKNIHPVGTYYSQRKIGDENINWNWKSRHIYNFIRAINQPDGPGARAFLESGEEVIINKAELVQNAIDYISIPGAILFKDGDNIFVKTKDNLIKLTEYTSTVSLYAGKRFKTST